MIKYSLFTAILLLTLNSCADKEINYVDIPRTKISIKPPAGFLVSFTFTGLDNFRGSTIVVNEIPNENYYVYINDFKKNYSDIKEVKLLNEKDTIIEGYDAKIINKTNDLYASDSYTIIFGDSSFTVSIDANFTPGNKKAEVLLLQSIKSIKYNINKAVDPFEKVRFVIDTTTSQFKFTEYSYSTYYYKIRHFDSLESTLVTIHPEGLGSSNTLEEYCNLSYYGLEKFGLIGFIEGARLSGEINGCKFISTIGDGYYGTQKTFVYHYLLAKKSYSFSFVGVCRFEDKKIRDEIIEFAKTLRFVK